MCDNGVGGPLDPDSMSTAFKRFARRSACRPACASTTSATPPLAWRSRPARRSSRCRACSGHSTLAFTHKQYVAPTAAQTQAAVSALERLYATD